MKLPKAVQLKSGAYRIQLKLGGKSVMVYGDTEAQCRRQATLIKSEHLSGKVVQRKCNFTTMQAIDDYVASKPKLSPCTVRGYETIKKNRFKDQMDEIIDSVDWQAALDNEPCSPKTLKNAWGLVSSAMRHVGVTPPTVTLPAVVVSEHAFLEPEQIPTFLDAIRGKTFELAALLGLHSLRRSEICDVTMADVNIKKGTIRVKGAAVPDKDNKIVHKSENKNAASTRTVHIVIPRLTEILEQMQREGYTGYLVTNHPNSIYKAVNSVCEKAGLPKIGCHGLRHSYVSLCYHLGWSEAATMREAGYQDIYTMRKIYTHLAAADKEKDIKTMQNFFSSQPQKPKSTEKSAAIS